MAEDTIVYSWRKPKSPLIGAKEITSKMNANFMDPKVVVQNARGVGLYTSTRPNGALWYGNQAPNSVLVEIVIPKGTLFVNETSLPKNIREMVKEEAVAWKDGPLFYEFDGGGGPGNWAVVKNGVGAKIRPFSGASLSIKEAKELLESAHQYPHTQASLGLVLRPKLLGEIEKNPMLIFEKWTRGLLEKEQIDKILADLEPKLSVKKLVEDLVMQPPTELNSEMVVEALKRRPKQVQGYINEAEAKYLKGLIDKNWFSQQELLGYLAESTRSDVPTFFETILGRTPDMTSPEKFGDLIRLFKTPQSQTQFVLAAYKTQTSRESLDKVVLGANRVLGEKENFDIIFGMLDKEAFSSSQLRFARRYFVDYLRENLGDLGDVNSIKKLFNLDLISCDSSKCVLEVFHQYSSKFDDDMRARWLAGVEDMAARRNWDSFYVLKALEAQPKLIPLLQHSDNAVILDRLLDLTVQHSGHEKIRILNALLTGSLPEKFWTPDRLKYLRHLEPDGLSKTLKSFPELRPVIVQELPNLLTEYISRGSARGTYAEWGEPWLALYRDHKIPLTETVDPLLRGLRPCTQKGCLDLFLDLIRLNPSAPRSTMVALGEGLGRRIKSYDEGVRILNTPGLSEDLAEGVGRTLGDFGERIKPDGRLKDNARWLLNSETQIPLPIKKKVLAGLISSGEHSWQLIQGLMGALEGVPADPNGTTGEILHSALRTVLRSQPESIGATTFVSNLPEFLKHLNAKAQGDLIAEIAGVVANDISVARAPGAFLKNANFSAEVRSSVLAQLIRHPRLNDRTWLDVAKVMGPDAFSPAVVSATVSKLQSQKEVARLFEGAFVDATKEKSRELNQTLSKSWSHIHKLSKDESALNRLREVHSEVESRAGANLINRARATLMGARRDRDPSVAAIPEGIQKFLGTKEWDRLSAADQVRELREFFLQQSGKHTSLSTDVLKWAYDNVPDHDIMGVLPINTLNARDGILERGGFQRVTNLLQMNEISVDERVKLLRRLIEVDKSQIFSVIQAVEGGRFVRLPFELVGPALAAAESQREMGVIVAWGGQGAEKRDFQKVKALLASFKDKFIRLGADKGAVDSMALVSAEGHSTYISWGRNGKWIEQYKDQIKGPKPKVKFLDKCKNNIDEVLDLFF